MLKTNLECRYGMNIQDWSSQAEELRVQLGEEYWKMRVGLHYSENRIKQLEAASGAHHADFLTQWKDPRLTYIDAVEAVANAAVVDVSLRFEEERKKGLFALIICLTALLLIGQPGGNGLSLRMTKRAKRSLTPSSRKHHISPRLFRNALSRDCACLQTTAPTPYTRLQNTTNLPSDNYDL